MNFTAFQNLRARLLGECPGIIDAGETNLYRALSSLIPPAAPAAPGTVHRCHLASDWVRHFGLPDDYAIRALVTSGVRDSLATLFQEYASRGLTVLLPEDNYPVYADLAEVASVKTRHFPTLPYPDFDLLPDGDVLLVTHPLKPLGRHFLDHELEAIEGWLAVSRKRRLILDTVYTFTNQLHPGTLRLFDEGQTIILHSLTKGWLHPRLFGVALVPDSDAQNLSPIFRAKSPGQEHLARAHSLLQEHPGMPDQIRLQLAEARSRLADALPFPLPSTDAASYLIPVLLECGELLDRHNLLALPASAFGSGRTDLSVLSTLSFCPIPNA